MKTFTIRFTNGYALTVKAVDMRMAVKLAADCFHRRYPLHNAPLHVKGA